jgi:hypothetical protein
MCLLIVNQDGKAIDKDILDEAVRSNPHGFGMTRLDTFETVRDLSSKPFGELANAGFPFVAHVRYATRGAKTIGNCHPAPIHRKLGDKGPLLFMNGTISRLGCENDSDTVHLARHLATFPRQYWAKILALTEPRYAVAHTDGSVDIFNKESWTLKEGVWFSNDRAIKAASWGSYKYGVGSRKSAYSWEGGDGYDYNYQSPGTAKYGSAASSLAPSSSHTAHIIEPSGGAMDKWNCNKFVDKNLHTHVILFDKVFGNKGKRLRNRLIKAGGIPSGLAKVTSPFPLLKFDTGAYSLMPVYSVKGAKQVTGEVWNLVTAASRALADREFLVPASGMVRGSLNIFNPHGTYPAQLTLWAYTYGTTGSRTIWDKLSSKYTISEDMLLDRNPFCTGFIGSTATAKVNNP